jgi:ribose/xylose/arabinose/galactoside ABC-type transport system permease subunit
MGGNREHAQQGLESPEFRDSPVSSVAKFFRTGFSEGIPILILLAFFIILSFASPSFLTLNNLSNLVRQVVIIGVVAIGMTIVIISAGIDLSVGSVVGFSNVLVAIVMTHGRRHHPFDSNRSRGRHGPWGSQRSVDSRRTRSSVHCHLGYDAGGSGTSHADLGGANDCRFCLDHF